MSASVMSRTTSSLTFGHTSQSFVARDAFTSGNDQCHSEM